MTHVRQQIRAQVASSLGSMNGLHVTTNRTLNLQALPSLAVITGSESERGAERDSPNINRRYDRDVILQLRIADLNAEGVEDTLDGFAARAEVIVASDGTFGGMALESVYLGTSIRFDESAEGDPLAFLEIEYRVWYRTSALDPETSI